MKKRGQIRVGRCTYEGGERKDPHFGGFTPIVVLTKSSEYGALGPYVLKDEKGRIMENVWQGAKVYESVPASEQTYSRYDKRIIWSHPTETHATWDPDTKTWNLGKKYLAWRKKLMECPDAVRYPVGFNHRHKCLFAMAEKEDGTINPKPLKYVEARKKIYVPVYTNAAKKTPMFKVLKKRLEDGESLLIVEVDAPHEESLVHYIQEYNVKKDFIIGGTMLATPENLSIMLNDDLHPYGHGYCLATALLDLEIE